MSDGTKVEFSSEFTRFVDKILEDNSKYQVTGAEKTEVQEFEAKCQVAGDCKLLTKAEVKGFLRALNNGKLGDYTLEEQDKAYALKVRGHLTNDARAYLTRYLTPIGKPIRTRIRRVPDDPKASPKPEPAATPARHPYEHFHYSPGLPDGVVRMQEAAEAARASQSRKIPVGTRVARTDIPKTHGNSRTGVVVEDVNRECKKDETAVYPDTHAPGTKRDPGDYSCVPNIKLIPNK